MIDIESGIKPEQTKRLAQKLGFKNIKEVFSLLVIIFLFIWYLSGPRANGTFVQTFFVL